MSQSTPDDLAISFRSLPRRLREASLGDVDPRDAANAATRVDEAVAAAAQLLGCSPSIESLAAAIQQRPLNDWTAAQLAALQGHATDAGTAIRVLHDAADGRD
ncbi:MAG: hypothetical protein WCK14_06460 [Actinomycetota bacterium]|jgi:hypothetical protein